jgi:energy-coupling factor transport system substrate-specific component
MSGAYLSFFSLMVVITTLAAIHLLYERRRVAPAEIAVIATLAALAGVGRVPFAAVPSVQPTTFLVLVCGRVFGPVAGFIIGSLAAFSSNFFLGHGPWTPWQMLAWGLAGVCGGLVPQSRGTFDRWLFTIVAFIWGFLFGWILNIWHWLSFVYPLTIHSFAAVMLTSLVFDSMHASGNALFMFLLGPELAAILQRFKRRLSFSYLPAEDLSRSHAAELEE